MAEDEELAPTAAAAWEPDGDAEAPAGKEAPAGAKTGAKPLSL